ncbi:MULTISPECIES: branched-chain amino acid ABC transporter permease [Amycolatopsis]|uniref:Branched-chain amino acid transport system permease protein n=2 Tax=Amycolatopsis TaxID=1813 RepID=A0A1I4BL74_9PSEU|nr:branched-chain amino acid ABC transporter permease [Amycolatopsis sacchari]SFK69548.1 branched-chain amino acid transport system permease protein [Amycolatopsis sacchari]
MRRYVGWAGLLVVAGLLPFVVTGGPARLLAITALIYSLLAASWNLTLGFGGIFNFAHVGFFGAGGYTMAVATVSWGWAPWPGLLLAAVVGGVAGGLAYLPVVRMRGIYIALVTFIFVQLCYYLVLALPGLTGGSVGLTGVPSLSIGGFSLARYYGLGYLWLLGVAVALLLILLGVVLRSDFGRSIIALRDNENLAVSRGISRVRQHLLVFVLSGAIAGAAGALYVSYFRVADNSLFSFGFVTLGLSMVFLGGTGYAWGPVLGGVVVTFLNEKLTGLGAYSAVVIGLGTVLVLVFLPRGLAGLLHDGFTAAARSLTKKGKRAHAT